MSTPRTRRGTAMFAAVALVVAGLASATGSATADSAPVPVPAPSTTSATAPAPSDGRLIVGLEPDASASDAAAIASDAGVTGAQVVDEHTIVVEAPPGGVDGAKADELREDDRVTYVEPNYKISSSFTPNDPSFPTMTTLLDTQPGGTRAQSAWNTTLGSRDIVVGVLDSGIDTTHPDLIANLWRNRLGVGGCGYGTHGYNSLTGRCTTDDRYGHGTHVSGIIGATGNNGLGITGVAPRVSLMSLTMLDAEGNGFISGAIAAIDWAVRAKQAGVGLRVLSASWGGGGYSQGLADAIKRAGDAGMLFVTAAGNSRLNVDQSPIYPCAAGLANVVCVAATAGNDHLSSFSDYGAGHVDLAAPGENVLSTVPRGVLPGCGQNLYCAMDGTSMAAPMVSGTAVLALSADPNLSVAALRARLVQAVDPVVSLSGKVVSGGRLDVCKAVPGCGGGVARPPSAPTALRRSVTHGRATLRWSPPASNGNGTGITDYVVDGPTGTQAVGASIRSITVTGLADNVNARYSVRARNGSGTGPATQGDVRSLSGGFVGYRTGQIARVVAATGPRPSEPSATKLSAGQGQARGLAVLPDGTGGYVLDAFGGLHPFAIGNSPRPPAARGGRYTKAGDWARGVVLLPDGTGGYVLDGAGNLYGFSVGDNIRPTRTKVGPAGTSDIARGVAITPSGTGGYLVDRSGAIFRFGIDGGALPAAASGGPSWPGQDMARGIALVRGGGGGFVLDRFGGLHPFRTDGTTPARPVKGPSWPGVDAARGVGL